MNKQFTMNMNLPLRGALEECTISATVDTLTNEIILHGVFFDDEDISEQFTNEQYEKMLIAIVWTLDASLSPKKKEKRNRTYH